MPAKISIITPTRNMAHFLEPCILSNMQQFYPNLEHIVVDGDSTDNSREILSRYSHLRWVSEPDNGLSDALNKGIRMATGEIIGWCNADDLYLPGTLTVVNEFFEKHPEIDLLYGDYRDTDAAGRSLRVFREIHFSPFIFRWLHVNIIPTPAAFWRKRMHDYDLWYDCKMRYAMDYDFLRRAFAQGYKFKHVSILFCDFRRHGGSLTAEGGQLREHELIVRRDASAVWKWFGPAFPTIRFCFMLTARALRTAEKCFRGFYFDLSRK
jgi:glycosyltransferase involved in cell wall biosynthesis